MALKCKDIIRELSNYLDDDLDWQLLLLVGMHFGGCSCTAVVSSMRNVTCRQAQGRVLELPEHLGEGMTFRLRACLCEL